MTRRNSISSEPVCDAADPARCELCGRQTALTRHHLIPRMRHRARRSQREYTKEEMRGRLLWVCRACHDHIHAVLSEKQLAGAYHTRAALLEHPAIRTFIEWLRTKPPGFHPRSRGSRRR